MRPTNKRTGLARSEMKKRCESLLNCRFRGETLKYEELLVALENIITDRVSTVPTSRQKKVDASALLEIGMATRRVTAKVREKQETSESWTSRCKLGGFEQVRFYPL